MIRVLFFGKVADVLGREVQVSLPGAGCTIAELRRIIADQTGSDVLLIPGVRASLDKQVTTEEGRVTSKSEVAFFSLFSGG